MNPGFENEEARLDGLFAAFRAASPDREPGANFMPRVWQRIEARQRFAFSFRHMAQGFVTAAAALTVALGVYLYLPSDHKPVYQQSYLEALAEANSLDTPDIVGPVHLELNDPRQ